MDEVATVVDDVVIDVDVVIVSACCPWTHVHGHRDLTVTTLNKLGAVKEP